MVGCPANREATGRARSKNSATKFASKCSTRITTPVFVSRDQAKPTRLVYRRTSKTERTATLIRERDGKTLRDEFHYRLAP